MNSDRTYDEAAAWLVRQQDDAMDWDGFTAWLEADPCHRTAYDELAMIDADLQQHAEAHLLDPLPAAANDPYPPRWGRVAGWGGGALAAGLALFLIVQPVRQEPQVRDYRSPVGKTLQVSLDGGARAILAPASHLAVDGEKVTLLGTAYFDVPHRPERRLTVIAGNFAVTDIGTRFSVGNEGGNVDVDVAEGSLSVSAAGLAKPVTLSAGHGLRAGSASQTPHVIRVDPGQVASWRSGKLQFDKVPLSAVVRQVSRYSGEPIAVDPAIADRPFTGVIAIHRGEEPARTLAQIMVLDVQEVNGTARLEPRAR